MVPPVTYLSCLDSLAGVPFISKPNRGWGAGSIILDNVQGLDKLSGDQMGHH